ncbi:MAG: amidohydrolase family protein [Chloroflexaceae bacterium]
MYDIIIRDADILQCDGDAPVLLPRHSIAVSEGYILRIAPHVINEPARETITARGMLAIPGLINGHAHSAMSLFRGVVEDVPIEAWFNDHIWPMETNLTAEDVYWGALLGIAEMIEAGITCVADHYFSIDAIARAVEESGIRASLAPTIFSGPDEAEQLARAVDFVARWNGAAGGRISAWLGPHSPYTCTPDLLARVASEARRLGVGIHIHLSETAAQVAESRARYGKTPVAMVRDAGLFESPTLAVHMAHPDADDVAILAAHNVSVVATPKTEMKLGIGVAPVTALRAAGVTVGLGSDGAASNNDYDILEAARLLSLLEKHRHSDARVMPLGVALRLATCDGARAIGLGEVTGTLREGLAADIVLLRRSAPHTLPVHNAAAMLLYSSRADDVDTVIVAGRVLMRRRRLLTIDRRRVLREAGHRAARLTRRSERRVARYPTYQG